MLLWYDFLALSYLIFASPYYLIQMLRTRKYRAGFAERLGRVRPEKIDRLTGTEICWIHAVSVGEVHAAESLVHRLKERRPALRIVLSTVTRTGQE